MKKKLSKQQLEVMKILWDNDTPLVASDIVKKKDSLNINTVQACLRVLVKTGIIEVAGIVYSGTVLTRSYRPLISKDEYLNETYKDIVGDFSNLSFIASLISKETDANELDNIIKLINKRKSEIEEK
ncbi:MAG: BlaI/MecI/CopY family transcriptional regulator [Lachnospiraceae bacterium]